MTTAFAERLAEHAGETERFLGKTLDDLRDMPERLSEAMRLAVMAGGKRFRPFLVIESAALFDVPRARSVSTAGALEFMHCYSLVHDDLPAMDNDRLRRGKPTVWAQFDDWTAILAGDALLTLSFEILARTETDDDPSVRSELVAQLALASGGRGMVGGQMLDLSSDKLAEPAQPSLDYVRQLQAMKTGALIRFACEAGAILGRGTNQERQALRSFGYHLGIVFQIADDLIDATGDSADVGKATGKDATAGKATQVSLLGIEDTRRHLDNSVKAALDDLALFGSRGDTLASAVRFAAERVS